MENSLFYREVFQIVGNENVAERLIILLEEQKRREKARMSKVQREGIRRAKARGVAMGRPMKKLPYNFHSICQQYKTGELCASDAAKLCEMGTSTFYRKAREYGKQV